MLNGVYRGIVIGSDDPAGMGRLRISVPSVTGTDGEWALPCLMSPMDSPEVPVGAGAWVAFIGGDPSQPVWLGFYKSSSEAPDIEGGGPDVVVVDSLLSDSRTNPPSVRAVNSGLSGKESTGTAAAAVASHVTASHNVAGITGLQTALDGKLNLSGGTLTGRVSAPDAVNPQDLVTKRQVDALATAGGDITAHEGKANAHPISGVSGLQTALDGKSPTVHAHTIANVTNLQTSLDGKVAKAGDSMTGKLSIRSSLIVGPDGGGDRGLAVVATPFINNHTGPVVLEIPSNLNTNNGMLHIEIKGYGYHSTDPTAGAWTLTLGGYAYQGHEDTAQPPVWINNSATWLAPDGNAPLPVRLIATGKASTSDIRHAIVLGDETTVWRYASLFVSVGTGNGATAKNSDPWIVTKPATVPTTTDWPRQSLLTVSRLASRAWTTTEIGSKAVAKSGDTMTGALTIANDISGISIAPWGDLSSSGALRPIIEGVMVADRRLSYSPPYSRWLVQGGIVSTGTTTVTTGGLIVEGGGASITGNLTVTGAINASVWSNMNAGLGVNGSSGLIVSGPTTLQNVVNIQNATNVTATGSSTPLTVKGSPTGTTIQGWQNSAGSALAAMYSTGRLEVTGLTTNNGLIVNVGATTVKALTATEALIGDVGISGASPHYGIRIRAVAGGWAKSLKAAAADGTTHLSEGVGFYGANDSVFYTYLGGTSYSDANNIRITPAGVITLGGPVTANTGLTAKSADTTIPLAVTTSGTPTYLQTWNSPSWRGAVSTSGSIDMYGGFSSGYTNPAGGNFKLHRNTTTRWNLSLTGAESGSNAGSDLLLQRWDDSNAASNVATFSRATGMMSLPSGLGIGGGGIFISVGGLTVNAGATTVNAGATITTGGATTALTVKAGTNAPNIQEWKNVSGTTVTRVLSSGRVEIDPITDTTPLVVYNRYGTLSTSYVQRWQAPSGIKTDVTVASMYASGSLDLGHSDSVGSRYLRIISAAKTKRGLVFATGSNTRWTFETNAETEVVGGNIGSDFVIGRYGSKDGGVTDGEFIDSPLSVLRYNGEVRVLNSLNVFGSATVRSGLIVTEYEGGNRNEFNVGLTLQEHKEKIDSLTGDLACLGIWNATTGLIEYLTPYGEARESTTGGLAFQSDSMIPPANTLKPIIGLKAASEYFLVTGETPVICVEGKNNEPGGSWDGWGQLDDISANVSLNKRTGTETPSKLSWASAQTYEMNLIRQGDWIMHLPAAQAAAFALEPDTWGLLTYSARTVHARDVLSDDNKSTVLGANVNSDQTTTSERFGVLAGNVQESLAALDDAKSPLTHYHAEYLDKTLGGEVTSLVVSTGLAIPINAKSGAILTSSDDKGTVEWIPPSAPSEIILGRAGVSQDGIDAAPSDATSKYPDGSVLVEGYALPFFIRYPMRQFEVAMSTIPEAGNLDENGWAINPYERITQFTLDTTMLVRAEATGHLRMQMTGATAHVGFLIRCRNAATGAYVASGDPVRYRLAISDGQVVMYPTQAIINAELGPGSWAFEMWGYRHSGHGHPVCQWNWMSVSGFPMVSHTAVAPTSVTPQTYLSTEGGGGHVAQSLEG